MAPRVPGKLEEGQNRAVRRVVRQAPDVPEGGWYRETWVTPTRFHPDGYPAERASATAIHFLLEPSEESRWHRGGPLTLLLGGAGEHPAPHPHVVTLGAAVERGEVPVVI